METRVGCARQTLPWLVVLACLTTACTGAAGTAASSEAQNKALVLRLYAEAFNQNKTGVVNELVGPGYVQHDKSLPAGADGQIKQFQDLKAKIPGAVATVKRTAADHDLVAVHWHASATPANEASGEARIDLFRVGDGKLAEHWSITQTVPATTASGNSLFSDVHRYPDGAPTPSEEQEEKNRTFAVEAYRKLSDGDAAVLDAAWDPRYYQHNPAAGNGTEPLRQFLQQQGVTTPGSGVASRTRFGHTLADGDLVWVFSSDYAVADIFRVVDGKIIEHWDVVADGQ
ncbi:nuclear transport factor 2 family protein [Lentzea sp. NPDC004789]